jgi:hypothetical protein
MGRLKDFPNIYEDLLTRYRSKGTADKDYKEYLAMAKVSTTRTGQVCCWLLLSTST